MLPASAALSPTSFRASLPVAAAAACAALLACAAATAAPTPPRAGTHADLVALFAEWRAFQRPRLVDGGVADYSPAAMAAQHQALAGWQERLRSLDPAAWPVPQQVDWHLLRAEMNGLDFDHRVLRPWAQNPAFYVTVFDEQSDQPAREGPFALGAIELWQLQFPLTPAPAKELALQLSRIAPLLAQARQNLTGNARDLWVYGIRSLRDQRVLLEKLGSQVEGQPELAAKVQGAVAATAGLIAWLEAEAKSKTGPSGVGIENYDWYLANVQLLPYTWADELQLVERELARSRAGLALEEQKNKKLPPQLPIGSAEEHSRRFPAAVTEYLAFLKEHEVLTLRDWLEPALRARTGRYTEKRPLEFFTEVDYRDPVALRTHGYHWFDLAWMAHEPHPSPLRRGPLLYNLFDTRTEGFATAMEELMMHTGLFDARPRSRELVYLLIAQRAARALGDLRMHANQQTLEQAAAFAAANTPRGWLRPESNTLWFEQHLYLQQPGYGTSYLIGKLEIDKLLAERARQLGPGFTLRRFFDELNAAGLIPTTLLRWELAGMDEDVARVVKGK